MYRPFPPPSSRRSRQGTMYNSYNSLFLPLENVRRGIWKYRNYTRRIINRAKNPEASTCLLPISDVGPIEICPFLIPPREASGIVTLRNSAEKADRPIRYRWVVLVSCPPSFPSAWLALSLYGMTGVSLEYVIPRMCVRIACAAAFCFLSLLVLLFLLGDEKIWKWNPF